MSDEVPKIEWLKGIVGLGDDGSVCFQSSEGTFLSAMPQTWINALRQLPNLEARLAGMQRRINEREPAGWISEAVADLEARGNEASALKNEPHAGKIMLGQSQAYRDAAALLRSYIKP